PASLEISAFELDSLSEIAEKLKTEANIDDVRFAQDIVESLGLWTKSIRIIGIFLVGAHVLITFIVILLVIGIKVAARRDEIFILQLLGATKSYISAPFIYEGMIYGVTGAVIAWGATYLLLLYTMGFWVSFLSGIPILPPPLWFMFSLLGVEVALGILVGSIGAIAATRRFLK
ncbi:MAG: FtsX-like permease family protein, partial [Patescibacteria group bacterium]